MTFDLTALVVVFIIGAMVGANLGVLFYSMVVVGGRADAHIDKGIAK